MTPVRLSREDFALLGAPDLVYVKPMTGAEILADEPIEAIGDSDVVPGQVFYALYGADGTRLAIRGDRASAVAAARAHEFAVVSVH